MKKEVEIQFISDSDPNAWADVTFPVYCDNDKCAYYTIPPKDFDLGRCKTHPRLTIEPSRTTFCHSFVRK
jgi:hypothetical protein